MTQTQLTGADAVFSYSLPFNLLAVVIMWPMRYILNARWFHKLNGQLYTARRGVRGYS